MALAYGASSQAGPLVTNAEEASDNPIQWDVHLGRPSNMLIKPQQTDHLVEVARRVAELLY